MDEQTLEQIKGLFQESYSLIYSDGAFDTMADQAEADGDYKPAVAQLVSTIINSTIQDAGVTDLEVLGGLGILLIGDLLQAIEEMGTQTQDGDVEVIISNVMQTVLSANPEVAQAVQENPEIAQMLQDPEGMKASVEGLAEGGGETAQGVLEGAQMSQEGIV